MLERCENDRQIKEIWEYVESVAPTDSDALDIFYEALQAAGGAVCSCGSYRIKREYGSRESECEVCGKTIWFTSKILLCKARRFKAYFAAVLIFGQGLQISGSGLSKLTGVVPTTGLNITRKFNMALTSHMPEAAANFSGQLLKKIIVKRTQETPAGMHPFTEQENIDRELQDTHHDSSAHEPECDSTLWQGEELEVKIAEAAATSNMELIKKVIMSLISDIGITADTIFERTSISIGLISASVTELELDGKIVEHGGFGQRYIRAPRIPRDENADVELSRRIAEAILNFMISVRDYFHGFGRKGLQLRLAGAWAAQDRARWGVSAIMQLCLTHPPVSYRQILKYVSPPLLSIMLH